MINEKIVYILNRLGFSVGRNAWSVRKRLTRSFSFIIMLPLSAASPRPAVYGKVTFSHSLSFVVVVDAVVVAVVVLLLSLAHAHAQCPPPPHPPHTLTHSLLLGC